MRLTMMINDYLVLRMSEVPEIEVYILDNVMKAGGAGEPALPSVAPPVANTLSRLAGGRLGELPFDTDLLMRG